MLMLFSATFESYSFVILPLIVVQDVTYTVFALPFNDSSPPGDHQND
jgi:hypothetical protein